MVIIFFAHLLSPNLKYLLIVYFFAVLFLKEILFPSIFLILCLFLRFKNHYINIIEYLVILLIKILIYYLLHFQFILIL